MISSDEYLERVVAGIHAVSSGDADVRWNEVLNGRQFDATVRFKIGTLRYLVLIEVKNRSRRATAEDVEAFVTKSRDQRANKAVFVTAAGFQKGAREVAERHGVDLFIVKFDETEIELPAASSMFFRQIAEPPPGFVPSLELSEPHLMNIIEGARLIYSNGKTYDLPTEASQMTYYAEKTLLWDGRSLSELVHDTIATAPRLDEVLKETIKLKRPMRIAAPDNYYFPEGKLSAIIVKVAGRMGRTLTGGVQVESTAFRHPVLYTNFLTGESSTFSVESLPLNSDSIKVGNFYFQLHPLRYLYCSEISNGLVTWDMIESFQCGQLIRSTFTQKLSFGCYYIPVTDERLLRRLRRRLSDYRTL